MVAWGAKKPSYATGSRKKKASSKPHAPVALTSTNGPPVFTG